MSAASFLNRFLAIDEVDKDDVAEAILLLAGCEEAALALIRDYLLMDVNSQVATEERMDEYSQMEPDDEFVT